MYYFEGVVASLVVSMLSFGSGLLSRLMPLHANMTILGLRKSWATGGYKRGGAWWWELPTWAVLTVMNAALSWLGLVIWFAIVVRGRWSMYFGAPPAVRQAQWRFRNVAMDVRQAVRNWIQVMEGAAGEPMDAEAIAAVGAAWFPEGPLTPTDRAVFFEFRRLYLEKGGDAEDAFPLGETG